MWASLGGFGFITMASSLESLCVLDELALDESDSEADSFDAVVGKLFSLAGSTVAGDLTAWVSAEDADSVLMEAVGVVKDLKGSKVYNLVTDSLDRDMGVVHRHRLSASDGNIAKVDIDTNTGEIVRSFLFGGTVGELSNDNLIGTNRAAAVDCETVKREGLAFGVHGEDQVTEFTFSIPRTSVTNESNLLLVEVPNRGRSLVDGSIENEES